MTDIPETTEPKKRNGWGGARANSGGARKGAGGARANSGGYRPGSGPKKKIKPPKQRESFALHEGKSTPRGPVVSKMVTTSDGKRRPGITTTGALSQFESAWVYVGVRKSDGFVKIGMSGNVPQRCSQLGMSQFFAHPIVPGLAKTLESMALRRLGAMKCGSEWVCCKPEDAAAAVIAARTELSRFCHADPNETPKEAYSRRIGSAA